MTTAGILVGRACPGMAAREAQLQQLQACWWGLGSLLAQLSERSSCPTACADCGASSPLPGAEVALEQCLSQMWLPARCGSMAVALGEHCRLPTACGRRGNCQAWWVGCGGPSVNCWCGASGANKVDSVRIGFRKHVAS